MRDLECLVRDEDEDLRFASVRPSPGGTLLVLVAMDEEHVLLYQQWPTELAGHERRYSLASGDLLA